MITKITHITLFVHNQEEALNFYKKLGFIIHTDAQFGESRWLTLHLPEQKDVEVVLMEARNTAEKALVGKQVGFVNLESSDCQRDHVALKALGIKIIEQPSKQPWGISMVIEDLYGNPIYVCQGSTVENYTI